MAGSERDWGPVDEIDVEAIGEPGHRTFRLLLAARTDTASLWMEKEQLEALALIIEQQVARSGRPSRGETPLLTLAGRFPSGPTLDFKVGRMAVAFEAERGQFVFTAHPIDGEDAAPLAWAATEPQVQALSAKISAVAAAGRPRCPLCGAPIEGKHVCPVSNGHVQ